MTSDMVLSFLDLECDFRVAFGLGVIGPQAARSEHLEFATGRISVRVEIKFRSLPANYFFWRKSARRPTAAFRSERHAEKEPVKKGGNLRLALNFRQRVPMKGTTNHLHVARIHGRHPNIRAP